MSRERSGPGDDNIASSARASLCDCETPGPRSAPSQPRDAGPGSGRLRVYVCVLLLLSTLRVCLATPVSGIIILCYVARCRPCPVSALYIFQPMRVARLSAAVTVQVYRAQCTRVHWRARPLSCSHPPAETHRNVATSGTLGEFLVGPESEFLQEL